MFSFEVSYLWPHSFYYLGVPGFPEHFISLQAWLSAGRTRPSSSPWRLSSLLFSLCSFYSSPSMLLGKHLHVLKGVGAVILTVYVFCHARLRRWSNSGSHKERSSLEDLKNRHTVFRLLWPPLPCFSSTEQRSNPTLFTKHFNHAKGFTEYISNFRRKLIAHKTSKAL